jgi:hypothetical protein
MIVGAGLCGIVQYFYNNKKFREVVAEERAKAERKIAAVKSGLKQS